MLSSKNKPWWSMVSDHCNCILGCSHQSCTTYTYQDERSISAVTALHPLPCTIISLSSRSYLAVVTLSYLPLICSLVLQWISTYVIMYIWSKDIIIALFLPKLHPELNPIRLWVKTMLELTVSMPYLVYTTQFTMLSTWLNSTILAKPVTIIMFAYSKGHVAGGALMEQVKRYDSWSICPWDIWWYVSASCALSTSS